MWFRALRPYRLPNRLGIDAEELERRLQTRTFSNCTPAQASSLGWVPALEAIKASGRPLLVTGHSEMDSRRDLTALEACYGALRFAAPPCQNPFRSRVVIVDPADATHMTSANAWAFVVEGL